MAKIKKNLYVTEEINAFLNPNVLPRGYQAMIVNNVLTKVIAYVRSNGKSGLGNILANNFDIITGDQ